MTALPYSVDQLRPHYEKTALARMGIPIERALNLEGMRVLMVAAMRIEGNTGRVCGGRA